MTKQNKTNKNLLLIPLSLIAVAIFYYLVIFLPQREQTKIDSTNKEKKEELLSKSLEKKNLNNCLDEAENNETWAWVSECERTNQLTFSKDTFVNSEEKETKTSMNNYASYSLDEKWIYNKEEDDWVPNTDLIKNCELPIDWIKRVETNLKEQKDECFKRYPTTK